MIPHLNEVVTAIVSVVVYFGVKVVDKTADKVADKSIDKILDRSQAEDRKEKAKIQKSIDAASKIPYSITLDQTEEFLPVISPLVEIAESDDRLKLVFDKSLGSLFMTLGNFFKSQYAYDPAMYFQKKGLNVIGKRLGKEDPSYLNIQNSHQEIFNLKIKGHGSEQSYKSMSEINRDNPQIFAMTISGLPSLYLSQADLIQAPKATCLFCYALIIQVQELGWRHKITQDTLAKLWRIFVIDLIFLWVLAALLTCIYIKQPTLPGLLIASILITLLLWLIKEPRLYSMANWLLKFFKID